MLRSSVWNDIKENQYAIIANVLSFKQRAIIKLVYMKLLFRVGKIEWNILAF